MTQKTMTIDELNWRITVQDRLAGMYTTVHVRQQRRRGYQMGDLIGGVLMPRCPKLLPRLREVWPGRSPSVLGPQIKHRRTQISTSSTGRAPFIQHRIVRLMPSVGPCAAALCAGSSRAASPARAHLAAQHARVAVRHSTTRSPTPARACPWGPASRAHSGA